MGLSTERHIEGVLIDVSVVPWTELMQPGPNALGEALKGRLAAMAAAPEEAGSGPAEAAFVFANYVAPG